MDSHTCSEMHLPQYQYILRNISKYIHIYKYMHIVMHICNGNCFGWFAIGLHIDLLVNLNLQSVHLRVQARFSIYSCRFFLDISKFTKFAVTQSQRSNWALYRMTARVFFLTLDSLGLQSISLRGLVELCKRI